MSRRKLLKDGAAVAAVACAPGWARAAAPLHVQVAERAKALAAGGQLQMLTFLIPHGSRGSVEPVARKFTELAGIHIEIVESAVDEINTDLMLASLSNSRRYDVALPATFGVAGLASAGALLPISRFAKRHEPEGFRGESLYGVGDKFDGNLYGFQADGDTYMMFYNKSMLENPDEQKHYEDEYGVPLTKPETWEDLDQQMAFFHRPKEDQWGGLLFRTEGYLAWEWWVRFHAKGVWPFSQDMEPQIASDAGVEALEEMVRATQSLHPDAANLGLFQNWERYAQGDVYCNIGWGGSQKYLNGPKSKMRDNMVFGPTPGGMVNGRLLVTPYFNWGWNYVVCNKSKAPEISYLFALFASSAEMSTLAVRQQDGFFDPFRPEHYDDAGIKAAYTQEFLDVHRASLEASIPDLYLKDQAEYFHVLAQWLARAVAGMETPERALQRVADRWRLITLGSGKRTQKMRWEELRAKYPANIRAALQDVS